MAKNNICNNPYSYNKHQKVIKNGYVMKKIKKKTLNKVQRSLKPKENKTKKKMSLLNFSQIRIVNSSHGLQFLFVWFGNLGCIGDFLN